MRQEQLFLIYFFAVAGGALFEALVFYLHRRITKKVYKTYRFSMARFLGLLSFPLLASLAIVLMTGFQLLTVFLVFAVVGTVLEWIFGFCYLQVVGQRLWTYHRFPISGHTSLLSVPFWGIAGIMFWLLVRAFG